MKLNKRATVELTAEEVTEALNAKVEDEYRYRTSTFQMYQYGEPSVSFTPNGGAVLIYEPDPQPEPAPQPGADLAKEVLETAAAMNKFAAAQVEAKP